MTDTTQHIKDLQLQLWLSKTPGERLYQMLVDNDAMYKFWNNVKPSVINNNKAILTKEIIQLNKN